MSDDKNQPLHFRLAEAINAVLYASAVVEPTVGRKLTDAVLVVLDGLVTPYSHPGMTDLEIRLRALAMANGRSPNTPQENTAEGVAARAAIYEDYLRGEPVVRQQAAKSGDA